MKYTVIQYVPDDVRGERINVAIIVEEGEKFSFHLTDNWDRVYAFSSVPNLRHSISDNVKHIAADLALSRTVRGRYGNLRLMPEGETTDDVLTLTERFL